MWYDPMQPGWGLSVTQQGDNVFVVLFVYDANHDPQWYVASNVVDTGTVVNSLVGEAFAGPLYRASGATYLQPNDATPLSATPVGSIQLAYTMPDNNLAVTYSVNGTTVSKTLGPQTWGSNAKSLFGLYTGALLITGTQACMVPLALANMTQLSLGDGVAPDTVTIAWDTSVVGVDTVCSFAGSYGQRGQLGALVGTVACGPAGSNNLPVAGALSITQLSITPVGFSGYVNFTQSNANGQCTIPGTIGGVKHFSSARCPASAGTESRRARSRAPSRRRRCARIPGRSPRAARCRSGAGRDTSEYACGSRPDSTMRRSSTSRRSSRCEPPMISPMPGASTSIAATVFPSSFRRM